MKKEFNSSTIKYIGDTSSYWEVREKVIALSFLKEDEELLESMAVHEITEVTLAGISKELFEEVSGPNWTFLGMLVCGTHILTILGQEGTYFYLPHALQIKNWKRKEKESRAKRLKKG